MTTIIIIVVVALVFFVTVCVVTFMIWKRETEIRTDSIRAIESNLERLGDKLTADGAGHGSVFENSDFGTDALHETVRDSRSYMNPRRRAKRKDPFAWIRENEYDVPYEDDAYQQEVDIPHGDDIVENDECFNDEKKENAVVASAKVYEKNTQDIRDSLNSNDVDEGAGNVSEENIKHIDEQLDQDKDQSDHEKDYISQIDDFEIEMPEISEEMEQNESGVEEINMGESISGNQDILDEKITPEFQNYRSDHGQGEKKAHARDIGRSGKRYTSEELDMLIKE